MSPRKTNKLSDISAGLDGKDLLSYLADVLGRVREEFEFIIPRKARYNEDLYDPMRVYPFREAKGLRPGLCYAVCMSCGGKAEAVLPNAAVLELYHNAFLVHDDVEDGSWHRRGGPTLHSTLGVPAAVNVGDGMLALCLQPLLNNTKLLGLGPALQVLQCIADMSRETVEGQALELGWIRRGDYDISDRAYIRMVHQKTTWYSFLTPIRVGCIVAGAPPLLERRLRTWGTLIGAAFQIQDDVLNLVGSVEEYGKEIEGDLWEGKHTLILAHALRRCTATQRTQALKVLAKPRPSSADTIVAGTKTPDDIAFLRSLINDTGGIEHAWSQATTRVRRAARLLDHSLFLMEDSVHRDFLVGFTEHVLNRNR